jgi:geranylgeranyl reductase
VETYDVIIVGAGPAGLLCAEILSGTDLSVLLLEKHESFGHKVCAGGVTGHDIEILGIPDELFEHKISSTRMMSALNHSFTEARKPFMYTVNQDLRSTLTVIISEPGTAGSFRTGKPTR